MKKIYDGTDFRGYTFSTNIAAPLITLESIQKAMELLTPDRPIAERLNAGEVAIEKILTSFPKRDEGNPMTCLGSIYGVRIILDETMPPNSWKLVSTKGEVMVRGEV